MNKIALVTGSSKGIGSAIAVELAKNGFDIIVHYNSHKDEAELTMQEIIKTGKKAHLVNADLTKEEEVKKMFEAVKKITPKLDLLVNNAGTDRAKLFEDYTINDMHDILYSNLWSTILVTKIFLPIIKNSTEGQIFNISSRLGKEKTIKTASVYGAAKAGIIKLTQALALELSVYKIRVNCVAPGLTKTDLTNDIFLQDLGSQDKADKMWALRGSENPSGRVAMPEDIANTVSFLASDKANYINGETIGVNGGSVLV